MNKKQFNLWNSLAAWGVFVVALVTYTLTLEPTASFWDCGEFIASSYKLEVGHPPGNPVFQLIARFFSMFTGAENAAVAINWMSGLCSAFTIFFLYLTIVFLAKRLFKPAEDGSWSKGNAIAIIGSGVVGALAYTFSDTFWFSAVEAEVYAMSSLFTALVFWVMTKWYEDADKPHADRWIVLVFFLMGLSIGVHLLNLLTLPALVFLYAYRKREQLEYTFWQLLGILAASFLVLGFLVFLFIPYLPKIAAGVDLFFVNSLGLPFNSGAAVFMVLLLAACFLLLFRTQKTGRYWLNLITLCFTTLVIGFSIFSVVIIRSSVKTPTNEYQPDNPYTLVRYLSREQYGSAPLVYGPYFGAELDPVQRYTEGTYWAPVGDKYIQAPSPSEPNYAAADKMLFPRMWSPYNDHPSYYVDNYMPGTSYMGEDGYQHYTKPSMLENLAFFVDFQLNWMYWRYFFWNFAGRQNDIHGPQPNELYGNWESGIGPLDRAMLGDQSDFPEGLKNNPGKNHYYMLPLLLGIFGLVFQFARDRRGAWLLFLMFFMTGIAIVLYLNQPPMQVRERDYAYAGSFYFFAAWIGLGVAAVYAFLQDVLKGRFAVPTAAAAGLLSLGVPVLMAAENWDDHDRSNRYTAVEMACNYLNSVGKNGYLVTHGDNDTFPLWYAQEVESVRTDVRILNTSLLGTDWHIDQMLYAVNESAPLKLSIPHEQYLYGTNEAVYVGPAYADRIFVKTARGYEKAKFNDTALIADAVAAFVKQNNYYMLVDYDDYGKPVYQQLPVFPCRSVVVPVNRANVVSSGILPAALVDEWVGNGDGELTEDEMEKIPASITLTLPSGSLHKPALFLLDLLANYEWDRPLHMLPYGSDFNVGQDNFMMYTGYSSVLTPFNKKATKLVEHPDGTVEDITYESTKAYSDMLYDRVEKVFKWDALSREDYYADYQNHYTFLASSSQRYLFYRVAYSLIGAGQWEKALDVLEKCFASVPESQYPYDTIYSDFASNNQVVFNLIGQCYDIAAGAEDDAVCRRATALGDRIAGRYGLALADGARATRGRSPLFRKQGDYGEELFYLSYLLTQHAALPREDTVAFDKMAFRVDGALRDHLSGYDPYPGGGVQMARGFVRLCGEGNLTAVDSFYIRRLAPQYNRVLMTDPALNYEALKTQYAYAGYLMPEEIFDEPEYGTNWLDETQVKALKASFLVKAQQCRVSGSEELDGYLAMVEGMVSKNWFSIEDVLPALDAQKEMLLAARGSSLDDLYEVYSICSMLDGLWTPRDYRTYGDAVFGQAKATWQSIQRVGEDYRGEYEKYFQSITQRLKDLGFLTDRQLTSFKASAPSGGYYR